MGGTAGIYGLAQNDQTWLGQSANHLRRNGFLRKRWAHKTSGIHVLLSRFSLQGDVQASAEVLALRLSWIGECDTCLMLLLSVCVVGQQ